MITYDVLQQQRNRCFDIEHNKCFRGSKSDPSQKEKFSFTRLILHTVLICMYETLMINTYIGITYMHTYWYVNDLFTVVDELDTEITIPDENSPVPAEHLRNCMDELKQKLQRISIAPNEAIDTVSNPDLKRHNHLTFTEEELVNNNDIDVTSKSPESNKQKQILPRSVESLPNVITDVDQDKKVWRYVCTYVIR